MPSDAGWSADGSQLLLRRYSHSDGAALDPDFDGPAHARISFIDITAPSPRRLPATVDIDDVHWVDVAGWRSPNELILVQGGIDDTSVVVHTRGGASGEVILTADTSITEIQLPRALLTGLATRGGNTEQDSYRKARSASLAARWLAPAAVCYLAGMLAGLIVALSLFARQPTTRAKGTRVAESEAD